MGELLKLAPDVAKAMCDVMVDAIDVGAAANGTVELGDDVNFTTVLAIFDLADPSFGTATTPTEGNNSVATLLGVPLTTTGENAAGAAPGTAATHGRYKDKDGDVICVGTAGLAGSGPGGADPVFVLDDDMIIDDQAVNLTAATLEVPTAPLP